MRYSLICRDRSVEVVQPEDAPVPAEIQEILSQLRQSRAKLPSACCNNMEEVGHFTREVSEMTYKELIVECATCGRVAFQQTVVQ